MLSCGKQALFALVWFRKREDLTVLAQDVEELVKVSAGTLGEESTEQLASAVHRIKVRSERLKQHAIAGARATDRAIRLHPYTALGIAVGVGFVLGAVANGERRTQISD